MKNTTPYDVVKAVYPIHTVAKAGVDVEELVKSNYPKLYKQLYLYIPFFNFVDNLDGILDYLYGEREIGFFRIAHNITTTEITELIQFIESNCEVKK